MRVTIIAVAKAGRSPEAGLVADYLKRLPWKSALHEIDIRKPARTAPERKVQEAERIMAAIPHGSAVIALDERGKELSSRELAVKVDRFGQNGTSSLVFIIGGADGLDEAIRKRADLTIAFGRLTWPHMLVRVMLAEQIYRVWSILAGHPYHRD